MTIRDELYRNKQLIINLINEGKSTNYIGKQFDCNAGTIWFFLKENKINLKNKRSDNYGLVLSNKEEIINRYNSGESLYKISKSLNINDTSIAKKMKEWGINTSRGAKFDKTKPTLKSKTHQVIEMYQSGKTHNEIAIELGYSTSKICTLLQKNNIKARSTTIYNVDEEFFKEINTEEKAYILGWWYSDGNVRLDGKIRVALAEDDKNILEWIKEQLKYTGPLYYKKPKNEKSKAQFELCINRQSLAKDLIKWGCIPSKSLILTFPDFLREDLVRHFVRGVFDGDGSINLTRKTCPTIFITGSYNFIYRLADILPCDFTNIYQRYKNRDPEKSAHSLFIGRNVDVMNFLHWIYDDCTCKLQRKYDKAKIFLTA